MWSEAEPYGLKKASRDRGSNVEGIERRWHPAGRAGIFPASLTIGKKRHPWAATKWTAARTNSTVSSDSKKGRFNLAKPGRRISREEYLAREVLA